MRRVHDPAIPRGMREETAAEYVGLSVSSIRAARARRDFPEPITLTPGRVVYLREDLDAYLDRKAGRSAPVADPADDWAGAAARLRSGVA